MRLLFLCLSVTISFATVSFEQIQSSYEEAKAKYEIQKSEHNITKLLEISKILYENNEKIKLLKEQNIKKLSLSLNSKKPLESLQIGDTLEVNAKTYHKTNEMYEKSTLDFFIYDGENLLLKKPIELYEKGGLHEESIKFELQKPSANYKICAKFVEDESFEECASFGVSEPIKVAHIIIAKSLEAKKSDEKLLPDDYYIFLPYKNESGKTLEAKVQIIDEGKGETLFETTTQKEPNSEYKKLGLQIPKSKLYTNQSLHVKFSLSAEGINPVLKEERFKIADFEWEVVYPKLISSVEQKSRFYIKAPEHFQKPISYDVNPSRGLVLSMDEHMGYISTILTEPTQAYVDVKVSDKTGQSVSKRVYIDIGVKSAKEEKESPKELHVKEEPKKQSIPVGTTKEQKSSRDGLEFRYMAKYDGRSWQIMDGAFKAYYNYDSQELSEYSDIYERKGALAKEGSFKNGKYDGKITNYYGNGQVKSILYYANGQKDNSQGKGFFANGNVQFVQDGSVSLTYRKDGIINKYNEKTALGSFWVRNFENEILIKDNSGVDMCSFELREKKLSTVKCYVQNGNQRRVIGEKKIWSNGGQILTTFNTNSSNECTNRLSNSKIKKCLNNEEDIFIEKLSYAARILQGSKGFDKYLRFDMQPLLYASGESIYYAVYNSMLEKKLFIHNNPSQKCQYLPSFVESQFIGFDSKLSREKKAQFYLKSNNNNYANVKVMIMKEFAKMYYPKAKQNDACYNEVFNFYKQLGYVNAY